MNLQRRDRTWAVVLAGGEGSRMKDWILSRTGEARPKQYCRFTGSKTMLEHTWIRGLDAVPADRMLTVLGAGHRRFVSPGRVEGHLVEQPFNRDTLPGLFFGLACVAAQEPEATVLVLPSDHFIHPRGTFRECLRRAVRLAERVDKAVLLAAPADRPETDYGWIEAGGLVTLSDLSAREVARFHEKPDEARAAEYLGRGMLWNTMIMAARARVLWEAASQLQPLVARRFERLAQALGTADEGTALAAAYDGLPPLNLSRDLFQLEPHRAVVLPMTGVSWCDWGRPERVTEKLAELGLGLELGRPALAR